MLRSRGQYVQRIVPEFRERLTEQFVDESPMGQDTIINGETRTIYLNRV